MAASMDKPVHGDSDLLGVFDGADRQLECLTAGGGRAKALRLADDGVFGAIPFRRSPEGWLETLAIVQGQDRDGGVVGPIWRSGIHAGRQSALGRLPLKETAHVAGL